MLRLEALHCLILFLALATGTSSTVSADAKSFDVVATISLPYPQAVAINEANNLIYVARAAGLTVIDGRTNAVVQNVELGKGPLDVAVDESTNTVYASVASSPGSGLIVIEGATHTIVDEIGIEGDPNGVAVNAKTRRVYTANLNAGTASVVDAVTRKVIRNIPIGKWAKGVAVDPDTNRVYVTSAGDGTLSVIDGANSKVFTVVPFEGTEQIPQQLLQPTDLVLDREAGRLHVAISALGNITRDNVAVVDTKTNEIVGALSSGGWPVGVDIDRETGLVYVANFGQNTLAVIDKESGESSSVEVGAAPNAVAVNSVTHVAYVANIGGGTVSVVAAGPEGIPVLGGNPELRRQPSNLPIAAALILLLISSFCFLGLRRATRV